MKSRIATSLLLLAISMNVMAQTSDLSFITNSSGLSNSSVTSILEDRDGRMWFGTWDGLNMFNGRDITVFKPEYDNPFSLSNNIIRQLADTGDGTIWVATDDGLNRLDPMTHKVTRFFVDRQSVGEYPIHMATDSAGRLFAGVSGSGLYIYRKDGFSRVNCSIDDNILTMFADSAGRLWVLSGSNTLAVYTIYYGEDGKCAASAPDWTTERVIYAGADDAGVFFQTSDGMMHFLPEGDLQHPYTDSGLPRMSHVTSISRSDGTMVIGNADGLFSTGPDHKLTQLSVGIPILSTCISRQGIIWAGTDMRGVLKAYSGMHVFDSVSMEGAAVRAFWMDSSKRLWIGTKGSGLWCLDSDDRPVRHWTQHSLKICNDNVYCLVPDGEITWIGTDGQGLDWISSDGRKTGHMEAPVSSTYAIMPIDSSLFVGTGGHGLVRLDLSMAAGRPVVSSSELYLPGSIVFSLMREADGSILVGTRDRGLFRMDSRDATITAIETLPGRTDAAFGSDDIICLLSSSDSSTWVGTSMGLLHMKGDRVLQRFSEKSGFPNNTVHAILEDTSGHIWASTNNGLAHLICSGDVWRVVTFHEEDGLQSNEFADGAALSTNGGNTLYFGGISGFNRFMPASLPESSYIPTIDFEGLMVDNQLVDITEYMHLRRGRQTLEISTRNNHFGFKFVPLDFNSSYNCSLSYLLEGYSKEWINLGHSSNMVFTNVPKGHYTLRVRCYNRDNIPNGEDFTLPVSIIPVWYMSMPMLMLYGTFLSALLLALVVSFRNERRIKQKMDSEESKFVFFTNLTHEFSNSLTLICGPCDKLMEDTTLSPQARQKVKIISSNSDRMRSLMQQIIDFRRAETGHLRLNITPVNMLELISTVTGYYTDILEREQLTLKIETPASLIWNTDVSCVEKIIFNLLSNAVKYTPSGHEIIVRVAAAEKKMELSVTNTGVGISRESQRAVFDRYEIINRFEKAIAQGRGRSNGIGLSLCKSFSEALGGYMSLESDETSYTCFKVTLPYRQASPSAVQKPVQRLALNEETIRYDEAPRQDSYKADNAKVDISKPSMIIVDDDPDIRSLVRMVFEEKYRIREAGNGAIAMDQVREEAPAIIVTDMEMPLMNGIELIGLLKGDNATSHIPVIMLSALAASSDQVKGLKSGADAYVTKPFSNEHLAAVAERLVGRGRELIDYSQSAYAALQQFRGALVNKKDYELVKDATEIIFREMENVSLTIEDIAGELAITKMQLYRKLKTLLGMTPVEYVRNIRLDHASKLLKTTNMTVQEVMYECGFSSKSAFSEHFRDRYGVTPGKYRA